MNNSDWHTFFSPNLIGGDKFNREWISIVFQEKQLIADCLLGLNDESDKIKSSILH